MRSVRGGKKERDNLTTNSFRIFLSLGLVPACSTPPLLGALAH